MVYLQLRVWHHQVCLAQLPVPTCRTLHFAAQMLKIHSQQPMTEQKARLQITYRPHPPRIHTHTHTCVRTHVVGNPHTPTKSTNPLTAYSFESRPIRTSQTSGHYVLLLDYRIKPLQFKKQQHTNTHSHTHKTVSARQMIRPTLISGKHKTGRLPTRLQVWRAVCLNNADAIVVQGQKGEYSKTRSDFEECEPAWPSW